MERINLSQNNWIIQAVKILTDGGIVIYPTETSYGLGVDATNVEAVEKLLAYKGGRQNKAISVAVANEAMAWQYVKQNPTAQMVFETLLPGPITLIAKSRVKVAQQVESDSQTLGIRYSSNPVVGQLVEALGKPITSTSANTSGMKQIYSFEEWQKYVPQSRREMVQIFLDQGKLPTKPPSTIIDTTLNNPEILRQGEIVFDEATSVWQSQSPEETISLGNKLIKNHMDLLQTKAVVIALQGNLGSGKTHFTKGMAEALGIEDTVNSPTYTIMKEYPFETNKMNGVMYHIDTWRLFEGEGLEDLMIEDKLKPATLVVIEWQQKANEWIKSLKVPMAVAFINIEELSETGRQFKVKWT